MTETPSQPPSLAFLTETRFPQVEWRLGGAFRFDFYLQNLLDFLKKQMPGLFRVSVAGTPPCLWSIDWYRPRPLINLEQYGATLENYARAGVGVTVEFDNPLLSEEDLRDAASNKLLSEIYRRDRIRKNAVAVANDKLAAHIRAEWPKLPLIAHLNRAVMEPGKRTADFYNRLAEQYDRVTLHPADCASPGVIDKLDAPDRFLAVVNDSCVRNCPVRREHMTLLSQLRRKPYSAELAAGRARFLQTAGCEAIDAAVLRQNRTLLFSEEAMHVLVDRGVRQFAVQDASLRNEATVLWEWLRALFGPADEKGHRVACLISSLLAGSVPNKNKLSSGLRSFSFGNYD